MQYRQDNRQDNKQDNEQEHEQDSEFTQQDVEHPEKSTLQKQLDLNNFERITPAKKIGGTYLAAIAAVLFIRIRKIAAFVSKPVKRFIANIKKNKNKKQNVFDERFANTRNKKVYNKTARVVVTSVIVFLLLILGFNALRNRDSERKVTAEHAVKNSYEGNQQENQKEKQKSADNEGNNKIADSSSDSSNKATNEASSTAVANDSVQEETKNTEESVTEQNVNQGDDNQITQENSTENDLDTPTEQAEDNKEHSVLQNSIVKSVSVNKKLVHKDKNASTVQNKRNLTQKNNLKQKHRLAPEQKHKLIKPSVDTTSKSQALKNPKAIDKHTAATNNQVKQKNTQQVTSKPVSNNSTNSNAKMGNKVLTIQQGESLMQVFRNNKLDIKDVNAMNNVTQGTVLGKFKHGDTVDVKLDSSDRVVELHMKDGNKFIRQQDGTYKYIKK